MIFFFFKGDEILFRTAKKKIKLRRKSCLFSSFTFSSLQEDSEPNAAPSGISPIVTIITSMSISFSSLWRRAEEACDAGIDALSSIASSAPSVPLLAAAADAARDALAPLRQPMAEGGWPRGHGVEIEGKRYTVESLVSVVD